MKFGESLRRAAMEADQNTRRYDEEQRLENQNQQLARELLAQLGKAVANELHHRSAPLTLVAEERFRPWHRSHSWYNARLVAVDKVWALGSFAVTQDGRIHTPGWNGVFTLSNHASSSEYRDAKAKAVAFAHLHGCNTIMGPLGERAEPAARQETGEWAYDVFHAKDGVLMFGSRPAEEVFAELVVKVAD